MYTILLTGSIDLVGKRFQFYIIIFFNGNIFILNMECKRFRENQELMERSNSCIRFYECGVKYSNATYSAKVSDFRSKISCQCKCCSESRIFKYYKLQWNILLCAHINAPPTPEKKTKQKTKQNKKTTKQKQKHPPKKTKKKQKKKPHKQKQQQNNKNKNQFNVTCEKACLLAFSARCEVTRNPCTHWNRTIGD